MNETFVSKTVSLSLAQVQWLQHTFGNVSKGIQTIVEQHIQSEETSNEQHEQQ